MLQPADPTLLRAMFFRHISTRFGRRHRLQAFGFVGRVLGDLGESVFQHASVVLAHRTDVLATPTASDHARTTQDALPQIEALLRAHQTKLLLQVSGVENVTEMIGELSKTMR